MNNLTEQELKIQSLEAHIAWLRDNSLKVEILDVGVTQRCWIPCIHQHPSWNHFDVFYRIAKEKVPDSLEEIKNLKKDLRLQTDRADQFEDLYIYHKMKRKSVIVRFNVAREALACMAPYSEIASHALEQINQMKED